MRGGLSNKYSSLSIYTLTDIKTKINYINNLKIYEYNVDKIFDECYNKNNKEFNFVAMLDSNEQELKKICKGDEMMEKFESEINKLNEDIEFTTWLSAEEDARKVNNTLIVNELDERIKENQIETAKNLLSKGMKIEEVIDALNVEDKDTKNEIKKISKKLKKNEKLTNDPDMPQYTDVEKEMELGRKQDIEKAAKEAAKEATKKEKIETARKMLEEKSNINFISRITGLTKEEIQKIEEK